MKEQPSNPCEKVSFILTYDQLEAAYNIYREQFISCDFIRRSMERLEERIGLCNLPYETLRDDPSLLHEAYLQFLRLEDCNVAYNDTLEEVIDAIEHWLASGTLSPVNLTAWTPLYEAYQAIAAAYHVPFVMQSIEPGERIYYNTDEAHLFFPDRYCVRLYEESLLTPCGLIIGEKLEDGEPFETETDVLERFRDCGYPAATLKELELMFDADELIIFEFTNPYLDLEQKNACA